MIEIKKEPLVYYALKKWGKMYTKAKIKYLENPWFYIDSNGFLILKRENNNENKSK